MGSVHICQIHGLGRREQYSCFIHKLISVAWVAFCCCSRRPLTVCVCVCARSGWWPQNTNRIHKHNIFRWQPFGLHSFCVVVVVAAKYKCIACSHISNESKNDQTSQIKDSMSRIHKIQMKLSPMHSINFVHSSGVWNVYVLGCLFSPICHSNENWSIPRKVAGILFLYGG